MDWTLAACQTHDPELFFPVGDSGPAAEQITAAKFVCAGCPIQARCLVWALDTGQEFGVWGGASEDERRAMRRPTADRQPLPISA